MGEEETSVPAVVAGTGPATVKASSSRPGRWADTPEQQAFRERVLAEHIRLSTRRKGPPQRDLTAHELAFVFGTREKMRVELLSITRRPDDSLLIKKSAVAPPDPRP